jgi:hypothetical protein
VGGSRDFLGRWRVTPAELAYALNDTVAWVSFGGFVAVLAVVFRVTWPRWH